MPELNYSFEGAEFACPFCGMTILVDFTDLSEKTKQKMREGFYSCDMCGSDCIRTDRVPIKRQ